MVETYISLSLKKTIDEFRGYELDEEQLEAFIEFVIRKHIQEGETE